MPAENFTTNVKWCRHEVSSVSLGDSNDHIRALETFRHHAAEHDSVLLETRFDLVESVCQREPVCLLQLVGLLDADVVSIRVRGHEWVVRGAQHPATHLRLHLDEVAPPCPTGGGIDWQELGPTRPRPECKHFELLRLEPLNLMPLQTLFIGDLLEELGKRPSPDATLTPHQNALLTHEAATSEA